MFQDGKNIWSNISAQVGPVGQDCVQRAFEYHGGWRFHSLSGQPVPVLGHPHSKKVFPISQEKPPVFHFVPLLLAIPEKTQLQSLHPPVIHFHTLVRPPKHSLLQAELSQVSQPFLMRAVLQSLHHLCTAPLDCLQNIPVSVVLGIPELATVPLVWL